MSNNNNRNNNNNNNRRRGRGNNRSQGGGNLNRIDSRARGNAPQLLEKYKKLAHDASLNGDRVQAEYYLQFADHYFRVLADSRTQKDESRGPRREFDRETTEGEEEFEDEFDRAPRQQQPQRQRREEGGEDREQARGAAESAPAAQAPVVEGESAVEAESAEPAGDNPFTRESRLKPRRGRRERAPERADDDGDAGAGGLDLAALPPAIGRDEAPEAAEVAEEKPAPRRRRTRARSSDDDQALEAVS